MFPPNPTHYFAPKGVSGNGRVAGRNVEARWPSEEEEEEEFYKLRPAVCMEEP